MSRRYAEDTSVSMDRSIGEIRTTLRRYGATSFMHMEREGEAVVMFEMQDRRILFRLPMPDRSNREFTHTSGRGQARTASAAEQAWEQSCRARWRSLALVVKAKLEAVAAGITEFETEFMGNIVMPDGQTIGDHVRPKIAAAYQANEMPPLLPHYGSSK